MYRIRKATFDTADVYCDRNATDGGWMVIQINRINSSTNSKRSYIEYEKRISRLLLWA